MLVDHADAVADRLARGADADRLAVDADLAGVGFVEAVEDRHQRRLAGAVLADDAVDDAALDDEIDVVVGVNRAEALVDADEFDGGRVGRPGRHPRSHGVARPRAPRWRQDRASRRERRQSRSPRRAGSGLPLAGHDGKAEHRACARGRVPSRRALVVGHVVVDLDLARDDVGFSAWSAAAFTSGVRMLFVVLVDRVADAVVLEAEHLDAGLPRAVLRVHEGIVGGDVDVLQHRGQDMCPGTGRSGSNRRRCRACRRRRRPSARPGRSRRRRRRRCRRRDRSATWRVRRP